MGFLPTGCNDLICSPLALNEDSCYWRRLYKYLVFLFFLNIGRCRTCKGSVFGSNFVASDVSWDVFFFFIYIRLWEKTLWIQASACACLNACFSPCASGVVHVCNGQDCFEGTLDERHPSAEIRRVKVSFRGARKSCRRVYATRRRLLAGFLSQVAPCTRTVS